MADLNLHQALTQEAQSKITHTDLSCAVNWMHQFVLEDNHFFGCKFIFRYGMPGKFPEGKWGMTVWGDVGVIRRPEVIEGDVRANPRSRQIEEYRIEFGSLVRILSPVTDYYEKNGQKMMDPQRVMAAHIAALSRAIPNYENYLVYKIFVGSEVAKEDWYIKNWMTTYIEPSDGDQNGYKFEGHQAYFSINLSEVISPKDKKENKLKKRLEEINKALRNDTRKVEVDVTKDEIVKGSWIKNNMSAPVQKTIALYNAACEQVRKILRDGMFDKKYMHKDGQGVAKFVNSKGEQMDWNKWNTPVRSGDDLILLFPSRTWNALQHERKLKAPTTAFLDGSECECRFQVTDLLDDNEAMILHKDLIQVHVIPLSVQYQSWNYGEIYEQTTDYFHAFDHSLDLIPLHCNIYLKLKA